jgi:GT2 family glycosyltransferase
LVGEHRLMVVDNGSGDLPPLPSEVIVLRLAENRGYAGGNNAGITAALSAGASHVFLVNSDVELERDCLAQLVTETHRRPAVAAVGPLVLRADAPDRVANYGHTFDPRTARHRELRRGESVSTRRPEVMVVPAISGCAMLLTSSALDRVGLLDSSLFLYFEDLDWCLRARGFGLATLVVGRARVRHVGGASSGAQSPLVTRYSVRNHVEIARRFGRGPFKPLQPALVALYHLAFLLMSRQTTRAHFRALLQGLWAAARGQTGPMSA